MNANKLFSIILFTAGEILIIASFMLFFNFLETRILILNIFISSIILSLFFLDIIFPFIDFRDKSQKAVGSLGLRWLFTTLYIIAAISGMIILNGYLPISFKYQLVIQVILMFLFATSIYTAIASSEKAQEVFIQEKQNYSNLDEIRNVTKEIKLKIELMKTAPENIVTKINALHEDLRFVSPSNNAKVYELEKKYLSEIRLVPDYLSIIPANFEKALEIIENCERTFNERKQMFSN